MKTLRKLYYKIRYHIGVKLGKRVNISKFEFEDEIFETSYPTEF